LRSIRTLFKKRQGKPKAKLASAIHKVQINLNELSILKTRLESRKQSLLNSVVQSNDLNDEPRSKVYSIECNEVEKVLKVINLSELALTQIIVRFESICDMGDAMNQMSFAYQTVEKVSDSVDGVLPSLESAASEANSAFSTTLSELTNISPDFTLNLDNSVDEIAQDARRYAETLAKESKEGIPKSILNAPGNSIFEKAQQVALLTEINKPMKSDSSYSKYSSDSKNDQIIRTFFAQSGDLNVLEAAVTLNLPVNEIEQVAFKMISDDGIQLTEEVI